MTLDERSRHELHAALDQVLGPEQADTLMAHLPPTGWADVARRDDVSTAVALLGSDLRRDMADLRGEVRQEMADLRGEVRQEMADLRGELRQEMADLRGELRQEMADLRADLARQHTRLIRWFTTTIVALNSGLLALVVALG